MFWILKLKKTFCNRLKLATQFPKQLRKELLKFIERLYTTRFYSRETDGRLDFNFIIPTPVNACTDCLTIFTKHSILDLWLCFECIFDKKNKFDIE